jgi:hypothetical protein
MGIVTLGPSSEIVLKLATLNGSTVFVETGTFRGETTQWASKYFDSVFTIERAESIYELHSAELSQLKGVKTFLGDSRTVLPKVVSEIKDRKAVFWLDGHWSGGETAGADDECPVLNELAILSGRKNDLILIDDARLFLSAPPKPHKPSAWPTIVEVIGAISNGRTRPFIQIIDDIIFIIPNKESLKTILVQYAQERSIPFWSKKENFRPRDLRKDNFKTVFKKIKRRLMDRK